MSELSGLLSVAANNTAGFFHLNEETQAVLFYALDLAARYRNWIASPLDELTDAEKLQIDDLIEYATYEVMKMLDPTPVGSISMYGNAAPPTGWLPCDGRAVGRDDYPALFEVIGETFGAGDGTTTFEVPDLTDRSPMGFGGAAIIDVGDLGGALTHTLSVDEIPAHNHGLSDPGHFHTVNTRSGGTAGSNNIIVAGNANVAETPVAKASNVATTGISVNDTGGGEAHNNLHPVIGLGFIIYTGV